MFLKLKELLCKILPETVGNIGGLTQIKNEEELQPLKKPMSLLGGDSPLKYSFVHSPNINAPLLLSLLFSLVSVILAVALIFINPTVNMYYGYFAAGALSFLIYRIFTYNSRCIKEAKKNKNLIFTSIIAAVTFLITVGSSFNAIYFMVFNKSPGFVYMNVSAFSIIYSVLFYVIITKGGKRGKASIITALTVIALFLVSNGKFIATFLPAVYGYIKYVFAAAMLIAMVVFLIIDRKKKANAVSFKTPVIFAVITLVLLAALTAVIYMMGDDSSLKYAAGTIFATLFGNDLTGASVLGRCVTDELLVRVLPIAMLTPGSMLTNSVVAFGTLTGLYNVGIMGGLLYFLLGFCAVIGTVLTAFSFMKAYTDANRRIERFTAFKQILKPVVIGLMYSFTVSMLVVMVNAVSASFNGIFGVALFALLAFLCHYFKVYHGFKDYILFGSCGLVVLSLMLLTAGNSIF